MSKTFNALLVRCIYFPSLFNHHVKYVSIFFTLVRTRIYCENVTLTALRERERVMSALFSQSLIENRHDSKRNIFFIFHMRCHLYTVGITVKSTIDTVLSRVNDHALL